MLDWTFPRFFLSPYSQQFRECVVCATAKPIGAFIHRYTNECRHGQREICDDCVYQVVSTALQGSLSNRITCPESECAATLSSDKVRETLQVNQDLSLLQRYEHHVERERVRAIPNNVECAHECGSWQRHLSSDLRVVCIHCRRTTCFNHRVRWHQGRTCAQFERQIATVDPASGRYINRHTKTCPGCSSRIERASGCPHMTCTRCEAEFCWICLAPYIDDGESTVCSHRRTALTTQNLGKMFMLNRAIMVVPCVVFYKH